MPRGFEPVQLTTQNCSLRLRWLDRLSKAGSERRNSRPRGPNKVGGPSRSTRVRAIRHTPRNFRKLAAALWRTHPVGASNRSVRLVLASSVTDLSARPSSRRLSDFHAPNLRPAFRACSQTHNWP